jgi:hypothetical protein
VTVRDTVSGCVVSPHIWLLQFLANSALFGLFALFLLIPVGRIWQIAIEALLALIIVVGTVVLHGGTLRYFHDRTEETRPPLKQIFLGALRNVLPIVIFAAVLCVLWLLVTRLDSYSARFPAYIRSVLSASVRRHVSLNLLSTMYGAIVLAAYLLIFGVLFPFVLQAARVGFHVFSKTNIVSCARSVWNFWYWVILVISGAVGIIVPFCLMVFAKPDFAHSTYRWEMSSVIIRGLLSYLLALLAWMLACSIVGRQVRASGGSSSGISGDTTA